MEIDYGKICRNIIVRDFSSEQFDKIYKSWEYIDSIGNQDPYVIVPQSLDRSDISMVKIKNQ